MSERLAGLPRLPTHGGGQAIGLLGGSFNPPHPGHVHISMVALKRLRLDAVWWLVSPGNPLKDPAELAGLESRVAQARQITGDRRIRVSSLEAGIGLRRTRDVLAYLKERAPDLRFVWLMGADNLAQFSRWHAWQAIAEMVPIAVIDRPEWGLKALSGKAAHYLQNHRIDEADAPCLAAMAPPAWVFLHGPLSDLSSTSLRRGRHIAQ